MTLIPSLYLFQAYLTSGNNRYFSFPVHSSVQESGDECCYGGVVYSFSSSDLNVWRPITHTEGYLVYIGDDWGDSINLQKSYWGYLHVSVVKASD